MKIYILVVSAMLIFACGSKKENDKSDAKVTEVASADGSATKNCTVTCGSTGKSYSWTCPDNKNCVGDCSDPNNPTGRCE